MFARTSCCESVQNQHLRIHPDLFGPSSSQENVQCGLKSTWSCSTRTSFPSKKITGIARLVFLFPRQKQCAAVTTCATPPLPPRKLWVTSVPAQSPRSPKATKNGAVLMSVTYTLSWTPGLIMMPRTDKRKKKRDKAGHKPVNTLYRIQGSIMIFSHVSKYMFFFKSSEGSLTVVNSSAKSGFPILLYRSSKRGRGRGRKGGHWQRLGGP